MLSTTAGSRVTMNPSLVDISWLKIQMFLLDTVSIVAKMRHVVVTLSTARH
jgi:hypothetical protein